MREVHDADDEDDEDVEDISHLYEELPFDVVPEDQQPTGNTGAATGSNEGVSDNSEYMDMNIRM